MTKNELNKLTKAELIEMLAEKETDNGISTPEDIYRLVRQFGKEDREHLIAVCLDGAHKPIGKPYVVSIGLANKTVVHPKEVYKEAIKRGSVSVAIAHNHPSGNVEPSQDDRLVTDRLKKAGEILGIKILDHLVISTDRYYSFFEHGVL